MQISTIMRELIRNKQFSILFIVSLSIGLTSLIIIDTIKSSIKYSLNENSKTIAAGDLSFRARTQIANETIDSIKNDLQNRHGNNLRYSRNISFFSMIVRGDKSKLVSIQSISNSFPLYGKVELSDDQALLTSPGTVSLYKELADFWDISIGDTITIGTKQFVVGNIVLKDPQLSFGRGSLAPKIFLGIDDVWETGLIQFGSTISDNNYFAFSKPDLDLDDTVEQLREKHKADNIRFSSHNDVESNATRVLMQGLSYVSLVVVVASYFVFLTINILIGRFFAQRRQSFALMKTYGMRTNQITSRELTMLASLSLVAVAISAGIAAGAIQIIKKLLPNSDILIIETAFLTQSVGVSIIFCFIILLLLGLPILKDLNNIKPAELFSVDKNIVGLGEAHWLQHALSLLFMALYSLFLTENVSLSIIFAGAFIGSAAILLTLARLCLILIYRHAKKTKNLVVKYAFLYISRDKPLYYNFIFAFGLSLFLVNMIPQVKSIIDTQFAASSANRPSYFLFDIQEDQWPELESIVTKLGHSFDRTSPMIRASLIGINGVKAEDLSKQERFKDRKRHLFRSFNLTFPMDNSRYELGDVTLIKGTPISKSNPQTSPDGSQMFPVIIEQRFAKRLDLKMDDKLQFNVSGIPVNTFISGISKINWTSFQPNFFITLHPEALVDAPKTFVSTIAAISSPDKKINIQKQIATAFPNVSMLEVSQIIGQILNLIDSFSKIIGQFTIITLTSCFLLIALLINMYKSIKWELFQTKHHLGMPKQTFVRIITVEIASLFGLAFFLSTGLCFATSWILAMQVFDAAYEVYWQPLAWSLGFIIIMILVQIVWVNPVRTTKD